MPQISAECFYDLCGECRDPECGDRCHNDEAFDFVTMEWAVLDEEEWSDADA